MLLGFFFFHCFSLSLQESNNGSEVTVGRYMRWGPLCQTSRLCQQPWFEDSKSKYQLLSCRLIHHRDISEVHLSRRKRSFNQETLRMLRLREDELRQESLHETLNRLKYDTPTTSIIMST